MNNKFVADAYNKMAESYSAGRDLFKNKKYLANLVKILKPGAAILDLGCGAGIPIDKYLTGRGFKVTGMDISPKQIKLAKRNVPEAEFEVDDMASIKDRSFKVDAVVSFYAIFHIPREEHLKIFKTINTFLPVGGIILVTMGASEWEGTEDFHGTKMFWSHYGPEKNLEIVKEAGFEILESEIDTGGNERHLIITGKKINEV